MVVSTIKNISDFSPEICYRIVKNAINNLEGLSCPECGWIHISANQYEEWGSKALMMGEVFLLKNFIGKKISDCHINGVLTGYRGGDWSFQRKDFLNNNKKCVLCGDDATIVHHIIPFRLCHFNFKENLVSVCKSCHKKAELNINLIPLNIIEKLADKILLIINATPIQQYISSNGKEFFAQMWALE